MLLVIAFSVHSFSEIQPQSARTIDTMVAQDAANLAVKTREKLKMPADVCVYVADDANNRVQEFTSAGNYINQWGSFGSGPGQFINAVGVAVDSIGNVYVVDIQNNRIQKFTPSGSYIMQWGSWGSGNGQFKHPNGIEIDSSDNVYVSDSENNRIQKFTSGGLYITKWGSLGTGNGQFNYPKDIFASQFGDLYVVDEYNDRIQKFTQAGVYISEWGSYGTGNGQFDKPTGIAIDSAGDVYVSDNLNNRVQKFTSSGGYITQWGSLGTGNGQLDDPDGIVVDAFNNVYVVDRTNNRIQKFTSSGVYITQWGSLGIGNGQFQGPMGITLSNCAPDLIIDSISAPATISTSQINTTGPYVPITITVKNIGNADATIPAGTKVLYQMVHDKTNIAANHGPTCPGCPSPLPYITFGSLNLPPNAYYQINTDSQFMWSSPLTIGNYHFSSWIDWPQGAPTIKGLVEESIEGNNTYSQPFVVVP